MGCDIHFHVEQTLDGGETWEQAEPLEPNPYFGKFDGEPEQRRQRWYGDRNYSLFAMLADVRNGSGFAGHDTGDPVEPIDQPRGLPENISTAVAQESADWGADGHSHSWFGLEELLQVDWHGNTITHRGVVDPENFDRWRKTGAPGSWCGGVSGGRVKHVSNEQMREAIDDLKVCTPWNAYEFKNRVKKDVVAALADPVAVAERPVPEQRTLYTQVQWTGPWAGAMGSFRDTLLRMTRHAILISSADQPRLSAVRAVFWFDN